MSTLFDVHSVCKYMLKFLKIELHFGWGKNSTNMPINFIGLSNNISKTKPEQLLHLFEEFFSVLGIFVVEGGKYMALFLWLHSLYETS